jgi:hypothetical protein
MGVLTDLFIANDEELSTACRGWKRPLPLLTEYREFTATNPFIQQQVVVRTRSNPDSPPADPDASTTCDFQTLPSIAMKGLETTDLAELGTVLLNWKPDDANEEIHGRDLQAPKGCDEIVFEIPPELVQRLAELSTDQCKDIGTKWVEHHRERAMSENEYTQREAAKRSIDDWTRGLIEIVELARKAKATNRNMFMWMCV